MTTKLKQKHIANTYKKKENYNMENKYESSYNLKVCPRIMIGESFDWWSLRPIKRSPNIQTRPMK